MFLHEKEMTIPVIPGHAGLLDELPEIVLGRLGPDEVPVRFVVTETDRKHYHCEMGVLAGAGPSVGIEPDKIFEFRKRTHEDTRKLNIVLMVPTGVGAEIGGHSGDAGALARLIASTCDTLITHPNVVNASDINELPENGLYVEGSVLTRFMMGAIGLRKVRSNRVILVIDKLDEKPLYEGAINAVSAARAAMGLDCPGVVLMNDRFSMKSLYSRSGRAVGRIDHFDRLCELLSEYRGEYDAVAVSSVIDAPMRIRRDYFHSNGDILNPWGGAEAMLTHGVSLLFDVPSAHSPMMPSMSDGYDAYTELGVVDPRKAAEVVSITCLHCIIKGMHRSPAIVPIDACTDDTLTAEHVSCLIIPYGCLGLPVLAALEHGIPVIAVRENANRMRNKLEDLPFAPGKLFIVDNYLEAAGVISAMRAGVDIRSVRRPLLATPVREFSLSTVRETASPGPHNGRARTVPAA